MFLGWYDPDRRKPLERKLDDALARYRAKFNAEPVTVLTCLADAEPLRQAAKERNLLLGGVRFVPASTFYIGSADESHFAAPPDSGDESEPDPTPGSAQQTSTRSRPRTRQP